MTRKDEITIASCAYGSRGSSIDFEAGAKWADEHPKKGLINLSQSWHDANEEPKALSQVVAIDKKGVSFSGKYLPYDDEGYTPRYPGIYWNGDECLTGARLLDWQEVVKWAYIDDLIPLVEKKQL